MLPPGHTVLEGGIASNVAIVQEPDGREVVVKQALPRLKVAADWRADPARSTREVEALRAAADLLGPGTVPQVLWTDADNHRFAMERIDPRMRNWRALLEAGRVDLATVSRAAELLALLHRRSMQHPDLESRFRDREFFEQLRIEPFFTRSAQRNPSAGDAIRRIVETLRTDGIALVHGDYSPKNLLCDGPHVVVLDWEVAHWGDPRFDVAFCLSHLILGGSRFNTSTQQFRGACRAFAEAYLRNGPLEREDTMPVALIGCLLLARIDGDSPVDYLEDLDVSHVRQAALQLILYPTNLFTAIDRLLS